MNTKEALYNKCQDFINKRLEVIQKTISDIQNSLQSETKSSAGDKHETGRAMLQLEREKAGNQLAELQKLKAILSKINVNIKHQKIALGSVVKTSNLNYFIAISAGEFNINGAHFYAISVSTPMAQLLISKEVGNTICFRSKEFVITEIQ
jgi:transcription elongation GreA/GreB family factor